MKTARLFRRRKLCSLLIFVAVAGGIFLCFQLFSINVLNLDQKTLNKSKLGKDKLKSTLKAGSNLPQETLCEEEGGCQDIDPLKIKQNLRENVVVKDKDKHDSKDLKNTNLPKGVLISNAAYYEVDKEGYFTCIHSKEKFVYSRVNDDFCDCKDGSDEPGTSACPDSKFYCEFQLDEQQPTWIWSSSVNDGVCDCCDGSDEWKHHSLPDHVQLENNKKYYKVYHSPCLDHCQDDRAQKQAAEDTFQKGMQLRLKYVQQAQTERITNKLYGPDGAFYPISQKCYELYIAPYTYSICPFRHATQQAMPSPNKSIGRDSSWVVFGKKEGFILKMIKGDRQQCPGGIDRSTVIEFKCGLEDKVLSIEEDERCSYRVYFSTPAACV